MHRRVHASYTHSRLRADRSDWLRRRPGYGFLAAAMATGRMAAGAPFNCSF